MDTALWPQEVVVKPIEGIIVTNTCKKRETLERKAAAARPPQKEQALNCPRCNSTNTKFCYYNNYSLTQPRYFCKSCRRYWTEGGSLRNIPVGGGSRKNKRSSSSSLTSSSKKLPDLVTPPSLSESATQNPKIHVGQDLNLAFLPASQGYAGISAFVHVPNSVEENNKNQIPSPSSSSSPTSQLSALELLTGISSKGLNSFIPMPVPDPNTVYTSGFPLQEFKPKLNFSPDDGLGSGYGSLQGDIQDTTGRLLFPFEDLKQVPNTTDIEQNKDQGDSAGYWTGMLGGGSW